MLFDQAAVHNLAAEMFWRMAAECGVGEVTRRVLATEGKCLLEHRFDDDLWREFPFASLPGDGATRVLEAVALEAFDHARAERNMIGSVCLEDRATGRSPSARHVDAGPLRHVPTFTSSRRIERLGRLCLRQPLPAVVFADRAPNARMIQVEGTVTALGFNMPMFLGLTDVQQVDDDTFLLVGHFFIPVPDHGTGALWNHVIQNSMRNVGSTTLAVPNGDWVIRYAWPAEQKKPFAWWRRARP